jgi:ribosomal protein S14
LDNIEQLSARGGQSNLPGGSIEQPRPKLAFQLSYQNTQSGRGNEQCTRCARETAVLRDQLERPELLRRKIDHLQILINS